MLKAYYYLTKPGIIYGNMLSATAGFFLASGGHLQFDLLLAVLSGTALVIASGCVFNNYIDRRLDAKMSRTQKRALVSGKISGRAALIYGAVLGSLGFAVLATFTNALAVLAGLVGIFFYVVVYGIVKRRSTLGTVVGSIPGATPPVAGYVAVSGNFDSGALLLFLILAIWQMPHFYAIAIFRLKDYAAAQLPVLPARKGIKRTKSYMLLYIVAFLLVAPLLSILDYAGFVYLIAITIAGAIWLWKAADGLRSDNDEAWARGLFGFSLIVLLTFCLSLSVDSLLR
jgi:protoheme IX farnesyltransferase